MTSEDESMEGGPGQNSELRVMDPQGRYVAECYPDENVLVLLKKEDGCKPIVLDDVEESDLSEILFCQETPGDSVKIRMEYLSDAFKVTWCPSIYGLVLTVATPYYVTIWSIDDRDLFVAHLRHIMRTSSGEYSDVTFAPRSVGLKLAVASTEDPIYIYTPASSVDPYHWTLSDEISLNDAEPYRISWGLIGSHSLLAVGLASKMLTNGAPIAVPFQLYRYSVPYGQWQQLSLPQLGFHMGTLKTMVDWSKVMCCFGHSCLRGCGMLALLGTSTDNIVTNPKPTIYEITTECLEGLSTIRPCKTELRLNDTGYMVESVTNMCFNATGSVLAVGGNVTCLYQ
eukprot:Ihof_evm3s213 gene=Ihof_evmTU3s213